MFSKKFVFIGSESQIPAQYKIILILVFSCALIASSFIFSPEIAHASCAVSELDGWWINTNTSSSLQYMLIDTCVDHISWSTDDARPSTNGNGRIKIIAITADRREYVDLGWSGIDFRWLWGYHYDYRQYGNEMVDMFRFKVHSNETLGLTWQILCSVQSANCRNGSSDHIFHRVQSGPSTATRWGEATDPAFFILRSRQTGKCLDIRAEDGFKNGAKAQQWKCFGHNQSNQRFQFVKHKDNYYQLVAGHSNKCLEVANASKKNGASIVLGTCQTPPAKHQLWKNNASFQTESGLTMQFVAKHSGKCLDLAAEQAGSNGGRIQQWTCYGQGQWNQHWGLHQSN